MAHSVTPEGVFLDWTRYQTRLGETGGQRPASKGKMVGAGVVGPNRKCPHQTVFVYKILHQKIQPHDALKFKLFYFWATFSCSL